MLLYFHLAFIKPFKQKTKKKEKELHKLLERGYYLELEWLMILRNETLANFL